MEQGTIRQTVSNLREWLEIGGYAKSRIRQFNSTTNQLLKFMDLCGICEFNMDTGLAFLMQHYGFKPDKQPSHVNSARLQDLTMLSEFQLHGTYLSRGRKRSYIIPKQFLEATNGFLAHRRFVGIIEKNMGTISLYLERFFSYLLGQGVTGILYITPEHIRGFLRFLAGFSNPTKDHTMRTVRQFLVFCYKNKYHPKDLSPFAPIVHYEKRARIPSAYSYDDVMKLLSFVDRNNPIGKALEQAYPSPTPEPENTAWQKDGDLLDWLKNLGK